MISFIIDLIWVSVENGFVFVDNLFRSLGLSYIEIAIGLAILTALFNFVLSPYLSASGKSDSAGAGKSSKKAKVPKTRTRSYHYKKAVKRG